MSTQTVEVALTLNAHVLNGPLASAQSAVLAQLKAAGNDLAALATKASTSILTGEEKGTSTFLTLII